MSSEIVKVGRYFTAEISGKWYDSIVIRDCHGHPVVHLNGMRYESVVYVIPDRQGLQDQRKTIEFEIHKAGTQQEFFCAHFQTRRDST